MRKFPFFLIAVMALSSCMKNPDLGELKTAELVITDYDKDASFTSYHTFYIPDSILLIGDYDEPTYQTNAKAVEIIDKYADNLASRNYIRVYNRNSADLGFQVSYVENLYLFADYFYPYWWWDYPYYWDNEYWGGGWDGWYPYPAPVVYAYNVGDLMTECLDLKNPVNNKVRIVWNSFQSVLLSGSESMDMDRALDAIDQSFAQSPYFRTTAPL